MLLSCISLLLLLASLLHIALRIHSIMVGGRVSVDVAKYVANSQLLLSESSALAWSMSRV